MLEFIHLRHSASVFWLFSRACLASASSGVMSMIGTTGWSVLTRVMLNLAAARARCVVRVEMDGMSVKPATKSPMLKGACAMTTSPVLTPPAPLRSPQGSQRSGHQHLCYLAAQR